MNKKLNEMWPSPYFVKDTIRELKPGSLTVITGGAGHGEMSPALSIAAELAVNHKKACAYFSQGTTKEEVVRQLITNGCNVAAEKIKKGEVKANDWPELTRLGSILSDSPLFVDDSKKLTRSELEDKMSSFSKEHKNATCIIDKVDLLSGQKDMKDTLRFLKTFATKHQSAVIAVVVATDGIESIADRILKI